MGSAGTLLVVLMLLFIAGICGGTPARGEDGRGEEEGAVEEEEVAEGADGETEAEVAACERGDGLDADPLESAAAFSFWPISERYDMPNTHRSISSWKRTRRVRNGEMKYAEPCILDLLYYTRKKERERVSI